MLDKLKDLFVLAILVAIIGGVSAFILGAALGMVTSAVGFETIIGAIVTLVLLMYIAEKTDFDKYNIFQVVVLLLVVALIGNIVLLASPVAASWLLTTTGPLTVTGFAWVFVYIGIAFIAKDAIGL